MGERTETYGLKGSIDPSRLSSAYRVGLLVVAVAMLVLPLVYLGIIAMAARLVWWHVTENTWILNPRRGSGSFTLWRMVFYFAPAAAGAAVVFFMIKPMLARPVRAADAVPLDADEQPALFELIRTICGQVRAPVPARVQVDCQVNASASFARLPWLARNTDLVLTIGLPLAAGLTVRQLAGVLAHEFGHFAQTGGMRLTFVVRALSHWLARVAHERDEWDEKLEAWASSGTWAIVLIFRLAQATVWMSRQILAGLMRAGHVISSFMLRQMEYDADSYELNLVGTKTFVATSTRLRELNAGAYMGYRDLHDAWVRRAMPINLPSYLVDHTQRLPDTHLAQIREVPEHTASLFDTHPSDADRLRAAETRATSGIFVGGDQPASLLFRDFDALCIAVTRHHYSSDMGLSLDQTTLIETEAALSASRERERWSQAIATVFADALTFLKPLRVPWPPPSVDREAAMAGLRRAREQMMAGRDAAADARRRFEELAYARRMAVTASTILRSGFDRIVPADFQLTDPHGSDAGRAEQAALSAMQALEPELQRFHAVVVARLTYALTLVRGGAPPEDEARSQLVAETDRVVMALNALGDVWPAVCTLYDLSATYDLVCANAGTSPDRDAASRQVDRLDQEMRAHVRRIRDGLKTVPVVDSSTAAMLSMIAGDEGRGEHLPAAESVLAGASALRFDLIGRLAVIVLTVEDEISGADVVRT